MIVIFGVALVTHKWKTDVEQVDCWVSETMGWEGSVPAHTTWSLFPVWGLKHGPSMGSLLSATGLPFIYVGMTYGSENNFPSDLKMVMSHWIDDLEIYN